MIQKGTFYDPNDPKGHILQLFPDFFEGVGTMEDIQVHLDVDPTIEPVVQAPHKTPHGMLDPLKSELDRMLKAWCNSQITYK